MISIVSIMMHWVASPQASDLSGEGKDQVIEAGVCGRLVQLLLHKPPKMKEMALGIVIHLFERGNKQKQVRGSCHG